MTGRRARASAFWAACLLLSPSLCGAGDAARGAAVLPPEAGPFFQRLLPTSELTERLDIQIDGDRVVYRFRRGQAVAEIELTHPSTCESPDGPLCLRVGPDSGRGGDALSRDAQDALRAALRNTREAPKWVEIVSSGSPPPRHWLPIAEALYVMLAAGLIVALWRSRKEIASREAIVPAALAGLALLLRILAAEGPGDIRPILFNTGTGRAGWDALVHLLFRVLPARDETIWTVNRIAGALSVPLLYAVLRKRFSDRMVAVGGATALAVTPLLVRFAATDTQYILLCAAFLGALVAYDRYAQSRSTGAFALALGLFTMAMQLRPEGAWLIVPALLAALALPPRAGAIPRTLRPSVVLCAVGFIAINAQATVWALSGHAEKSNLGQHLVLVGSLIGSPWSDPQCTPRVLLALVLFGALVALYRHQRAHVFWLAAVIVAWPLDAPATGEFANLVLHRGFAFAVPGGAALFGAERTTFHQYANARYHIPAMYLACGLVGLAVAALLGFAARRMRRALLVPSLLAIGVVCVAALPRVDFLQRTWTPQREFELFRDGLSRLEPDCRVVTLVEVGDGGFVPFEYLAPGKVIDIAAFLAQSPRDGCVVYYRAGNCFTLDLMPPDQWGRGKINAACRAIEQRFGLEPIVEAEIAAAPFRGEIYSRDPLPLGFYRLRRTPEAE